MDNGQMVQKPEWKDAPPWAKYLCKDHGDWYWAESYNADGGINGRFEVVGRYTVGVSELPEPRPV